MKFTAPKENGATTLKTGVNWNMEMWDLYNLNREVIGDHMKIYLSGYWSIMINLDLLFMIR